MINAMVEFILHFFLIASLLGAGVCAVNILFYACVVPFVRMIDLVKAYFQKRNTDRSQLLDARSRKCVTQESSAQTDAALK